MTGNDERLLAGIPEGFTLSVVVPVYNEARTLASLVSAVCAVPIRKQIILVDDCSKDGSPTIMESFADDGVNTFVKLRHDVNKGKGPPCAPASRPPRATR